MKENYQSFLIEQFEGLNTGPESSLQDNEFSELLNYLVTDEFKLEQVPGNVLYSWVSPNDLQYVYDSSGGGSNSEMENLQNHFRHVSGGNMLLMMHNGELAKHERNVSQESGVQVDWRKLDLPSTVQFSKQDNFGRWVSYRKKPYLAMSNSIIYYDPITQTVYDLNETNRTFFENDLGGDPSLFTELQFNDLAVHKNRMFCAINTQAPNIVGFTQPFKDKFFDIVGGVPKFLFVTVGGSDEATGDLGDKITRIIRQGDQILVLKTNSMHYIIGRGLKDFRSVEVNTAVGCAVPGSLQITKKGTIWMHNPEAGIFLFTGSGAPTLISEKVAEEIKIMRSLDRVASGVWNDRYYLISYRDGNKGGLRNNSTLCFNLNNGKWSKLDFGFESFADWNQSTNPEFSIIKDDTVRLFGHGTLDGYNPDFTGGTTIGTRFKSKPFTVNTGQIKKRWKGVILTFRSSDKALDLTFEIDRRYRKTRSVKTNPNPLWNRVKWNQFNWYDLRQMTKEVGLNPFAKGFRMAIELETDSDGRTLIDSFAPVYFGTLDSRGGKR